MAACFREPGNELDKGRIVSAPAIGAAIRERRRELGMTLEHLACHLDVTCQQVQHYECGSSRLTVDHIQRVSKALDVPIAYFFRQDTRPPERTPGPRLSKTERTLLECFRRIGDGAARDLVVRMIGMAAGKR